MLFPARYFFSAIALAVAGVSHAGTTVRLTRSDAVRLADTRSPALAAARAQAEAARAVITQARASALPSLTVSSVVTPTQRAPEIVVPEGTITLGGVPLPEISFEARTTGKYLATAELTQPLWTWGRTSHAIGAARYGATAADARADRARDDVTHAVFRAYHAALLAAELQNVAEQDSALRAALVSIAEARVRTGDLARIDLVAARAEYAQSTATLVRARSGARTARQALAFVLGLRDTTDVEPAESLDALSAARDDGADAEALVRTARTARADVRAARTTVLAARAALAAARRTNWPTLGLTARVLYQDDRAGHVFDESGRVYTIGIALSAPLFDGFRAHGQSREAAAAARAAEHAAEQIEQQAAFDARIAATQVEAAQAEIAARRDAVALAEDRALIAQTAFRTGDITATDVAAAAVALSAARAELAGALARALDADADLDYATGQIAR